MTSTRLASSGFCENKGLGGGCSVSRAHKSWSRGNVIKGNVTRVDSQRRFLAQHSVAMLEQRCNHSKQCRNNVATLCCAKNRRCESSPVTSPLRIFVINTKDAETVSDSQLQRLPHHHRFRFTYYRRVRTWLPASWSNARKQTHF